jgi:hypothetical protein
MFPLRKGKGSVFVGFEIFTAVTMKNAVFWDVAPCGCIINRRFGGTSPPNSPNFSQSVSNRLTRFLARVISSTLKMEATCSCETSVYNKATR